MSRIRWNSNYENDLDRKNTFSPHITTAVGQLLMFCEFCMARLSYRPQSLAWPGFCMAQRLHGPASSREAYQSTQVRRCMARPKGFKFNFKTAVRASHQAYQSTLLFTHVSVWQIWAQGTANPLGALNGPLHIPPDARQTTYN